MYLKKAHIHFMGIGGIGMSGIAKILKYQGYKISGCDLNLQQQSVQELINIGCHISSSHNSSLCLDKSIDILVHSSAINLLDPEIVQAQKRQIPIIPRALMLAELMRTKYGIAIAGAHGKTTTTSMVSQILIEAGMNPTVIIGGHLKSISTNAQLGGGDFLVAEADESDRSLLHLQSTLALVTNIDLEHLETYKDLDDIKKTFKRFLSNLPFYGKAIVCIDDENVRSILPLKHTRTLKYGTDPKLADVYPTDISLNTDHSIYTVWHNKIKLGKIKINMPGHHNLLNSLGAISIALDLDISFETIKAALENFKGIERRFSYHGKFKGAEVFDDYGHHPNEIIQTLKVARKRAKKKLHVIFQPHRYSRTSKLWNKFLEAFSSSINTNNSNSESNTSSSSSYSIDNLIITDIYPASEAPIANITSENLVQELNNISQKTSKSPKSNTPQISYVPMEQDFHSLITKIKQNADSDDLILLLGAGRVNQMAELLV